MKIWCDVCDKEEATVFCCADEAALCGDCDRRVHHANKLATKHSRFSLLHPSSFKESPLCDICQERRAFLFCQEDRAIFCRECDVSIHRANENTQKHNRFLLTGVKLTPSTSPLPLNPTSSSSNGYNAAAETKSSSSQSSKRFCSSVSNNENFGSPSVEKSLAASSSTAYRVEDNASISNSSVSGYLMEELPGWHLDDFPEPPSGGANGFCKFYVLN
ncbi:BZS1, SALT TOLERANCE HOMOLOG 7, B-box domain protein 20 [Hibiscus trionum]|uniref:BZS1, SALT TOLERANCE HOMOLOG 7, B-box domain protein 20 n=1 Tax=Hibiscus trionum TaxID=183268 RepID=A0A9W7I131_HIBTR|nr:BZS1, SALT TOLERANCE HOMOLOG 7, B-box domain protein 20 [Hibiscus trionum]